MGGIRKNIRSHLSNLSTKRYIKAEAKAVTRPQATDQSPFFLQKYKNLLKYHNKSLYKTLGLSFLKPQMTSLLKYTYHSPYDWENVLKFLKLHLTKGVEIIHEQCYLRTVRWGRSQGWLRISHCLEQQCLDVKFSSDLDTAQDDILSQIVFMFDLDHNPTVTAQFFQHRDIISDLVQEYPGLRIPRSFDGFELATRAILGQQISVKAATTLAGRLAWAYGETIDTPWAGLTHLHPTADVMASLNVQDLTRLGIIQSRAHCIIRLAQEITTTGLSLDKTADPETTIQHLITLPGIGDWTAHYIALRALRWNDAFLKNDLAIRQSLGGLSGSQTEKLSKAWQPWRSYATLYLWQKAICQAADKMSKHTL